MKNEELVTIHSRTVVRQKIIVDENSEKSEQKLRLVSWVRLIDIKIVIGMQNIGTKASESFSRKEMK